MIDLKSLEVHPDKCCHLLVGNRMNLEKIKKLIEKSPLKYKNRKIKEKNSENVLVTSFIMGVLKSQSLKQYQKEKVEQKMRSLN